MKRVLVVDDEPVIRQLVEASLAEACEVTTASDGQSALAAAQTTHPDLILLDLGLPGLNGKEVARRLRSERETASIPIVYLTGGEPAEAIEVDGVIEKPFTPLLLRTRLAGWLG
jgi:CheY-like chemotaxis protein